MKHRYKYIFVENKNKKYCLGIKKCKYYKECLKDSRNSMLYLIIHLNSGGAQLGCFSNIREEIVNSVSELVKYTIKIKDEKLRTYLKRVIKRRL